MKRFAVLALCLVALAGLPRTSQAAPIVLGLGDFDGSETLIDFNGLADGVVVNNQFAGLGLTFTDSLGGVPSGATSDSDPVALPALGIFLTNVAPCCGDVLFNFSSPVSRVGFNIFTLDADDTFLTLFRNGASLGTIKVDTKFELQFVGIGNDIGAFDQLLIDVSGGGPGAFAIDNVQFAVPEPSSLALLGVAAIGAAIRRKTRRSRR